MERVSVAEPAELAEIARRWAARLGPELESDLLEVAREARAGAEGARDAATRRFATLYSASPSGVALADSAERVAEANPALAEFLETSAERLRGSAVVDLGAAAKDRSVLAEQLAALKAADAGVRTARELLELAQPDGTAKRAYVSMASLPADSAETSYPVVFVEDADELSSLRETFEHQSVSDPLTNLANASRFRTHLESTLGTDPDRPVALIYLDIDGFRVINDGLGSDTADEILRGAAVRLDTALGTNTEATEAAGGAGESVDTAGIVDSALLARLSGDGFGILLRGGFSPAEVIDLVERAVDTLAEPVYVDDIGVGISASAGIVVRRARGADPDRLIEDARIALHRAKRSGKAQWVLYDPDTDAADRARYRLGAAIAGGLETGEFTVAYRPCVELPEPGTVALLKAELRWDHPEYGRLGPEEFYRPADTTGMTVPLGRRLLAQAAETTAQRRERHGDDAPPVCLSLPRRLAVDADLVRIVKFELERHDLPVSALWLCADSASLLDERGDFLESLRILAEEGTTFTLEVTGSADLELIPALGVPAPAVMLAGQVVEAMAEEDPGDAAREHVGYLVRRAGQLGAVVGATGVSGAAHARRLHELGVRIVTGPYLGELSSPDDAGVPD